MLYLPLWLAIAAIAIADARPVVRAAAIQYASKAVITDPPPANLARDLIGLSKLVNNTAKTRPDIVVRI